MPFCQKCGAEYKDSSNFCSKCGVAVNEIASTPESKKGKIFPEDKDGIYDYDGFYASTEDRFWALMIDGLILTALWLIIGITSISYTILNYFPYNMYGYLLVIGYLGYFALLEGTKGQTIGKMFLHIKVIKEDKSQCDLVAAIIRNLLRIIDAVPGIYIIGYISISMSDKSQRIGDRVAKTVVVKSKTTKLYKV